MRTLALFLAVPAVALASFGCATSPINGRALLPASQADLETLKADVDADRATVVAGLDAVKADLSKAGIAVTETEAAAAEAKRKAEEVASRPASGGVPGALIAALGGNLPPWLDWLLTLGAGALGINVSRNRTRKTALAKVAAPKTGTPAGTV